MKEIKQILIALITCLIVIIILQNTQHCDTKILFFTVKLPRAVLLLITTLIGFLLGIVVSFRMGKKRKKDKNKSENE
ncbi:MAG: DUF1049 domain-containing protein [Deltaproteobacteria bacterium]|nr:DUF1049 domain-containing protein [Deltaproteobacteria bacterium]